MDFAPRPSPQGAAACGTRGGYFLGGKTGSSAPSDRGSWRDRLNAEAGRVAALKSENHGHAHATRAGRLLHGHHTRATPRRLPIRGSSRLPEPRLSSRRRSSSRLMHRLAADVDYRVAGCATASTPFRSRRRQKLLPGQVDTRRCLPTSPDPVVEGCRIQRLGDLSDLFVPTEYVRRQEARRHSRRPSAADPSRPTRMRQVLAVMCPRQSLIPRMCTQVDRSTRQSR